MTGPQALPGVSVGALGCLPAMECAKQAGCWCGRSYLPHSLVCIPCGCKPSPTGFILSTSATCHRDGFSSCTAVSPGEGCVWGRVCPLALGLSFPPPLQPTPCIGSVCAAGRVLTCSESERARDFIPDIFACSTRPQHSVLFLHPDPDPVLPVPPQCVGAGRGFGVGCGRCCCPALLSSMWFGYKGSVKNLLKLSPSKWFLEQQFWLLDSSELTEQSVGKKNA